MEEKKKKSFLPVLLLAIILLGVGGYFLYQQFNNNTPKEIFISSIKKAFKEKSNIKKKEFNTLTDEFSMNVKVSSPFLDKNLLNLINKLEIDGKLELDKKNNNYYVNLNGTYDNLDLIKLSAYLKDNTMYMMLDDILDKWIKVDLDNGETNFNLTSNFDLENLDIEKYSKVGEEVIDALLNSLKDEYFKKKTEDGETSVTLTLDNKNIKDIITNTLKELKKSKDFKDLYEEMTGSKTFEKDIDAILKSLKDVELPSDMGKINLTTYTKKGELTELNITVETKDGDFTIVFKQASKDKVEFYVKTQGVKMFSGAITSKENKGKYTMKIEFSMMEMLNIELNIEEKVKFDSKLSKIDLSNSVESDKLTEKDLEKLEKLGESKGIKKFMEDLEKIDMNSIMQGFGLDSSNSLSF